MESLITVCSACQKEQNRVTSEQLRKSTPPPLNQCEYCKALDQLFDIEYVVKKEILKFFKEEQLKEGYKNFQHFAFEIVNAKLKTVASYLEKGELRKIIVRNGGPKRPCFGLSITPRNPNTLQ